MQLYYQSYPNDYLEQEPEQRSSAHPPMIIIPGLFGSTVNWRAIAKKLAESYPVIVLDQRNHGRSPHADTNSYLDMVSDLLDFVQAHKIDKAIICGHSMGGKVAMLFALLHPERTEKLIVIDIAPVQYQHSHAPFLQELAKLDLAQLKSRRDADAMLTSVIPDTGTRLFLLQNLAGTAGEFYWRINVPVLLEFMLEISSFPQHKVTKKTSDVATLIVYGGQSSYVKPEHHTIISEYFSQAEFVLIANAGHWLHAEQPEKVIKKMTRFVQHTKENDG